MFTHSLTKCYSFALQKKKLLSNYYEYPSNLNDYFSQLSDFLREYSGYNGHLPLNVCLHSS